MDALFQFTAADEAATQRCAAWLATQAAQRASGGWLISLTGDLGSGKTAFARGFIQSLAGDDIIVPSPTFTLLQDYQTQKGPVLHADLYRLAVPDEINELGLVDALEDHICLVEWAERASLLLPVAQIVVDLAPVEGRDDARRISISGPAACIKGLQAASQHDSACAAFLAAAGWNEKCARRTALAGDASTRRYERVLRDDGTRAVLMDWLPGSDGPPVYNGKSYSVVARLAEAAPAYCRITRWLAANDLPVPTILASDEAAGLVLLEDLGDTMLADTPMRVRPVVYAEAIANLLVLQACSAAPFLADYDGRVQTMETSLFIDWYLPWRGITIDQTARNDWLEMWQKLGDQLIGASLGGDHKVTVLRDYHSVNLLWQESRQGRYRLGLIDVQDALAGHPAYDLVSLLQDARIDVAADQQATSLADYCAVRFVGDVDAETAFKEAYMIAGAQRNLKIAGIFVRLHERDAKPAYLAHLPRIIGYIEENLRHSALTPVRNWFDTHAPAALDEAAKSA